MLEADAAAASAAAPAEQRPYQALAKRMRARLQALLPSRPMAASLTKAGYVAQAGTPAQQAAAVFHCGGWTLGFAEDGALDGSRRREADGRCARPGRAVR